MESSYSSLDQVPLAHTEADVVWLDHSYATLNSLPSEPQQPSQQQQSFNKQSKKVEQPIKREEPVTKHDLHIQPFKPQTTSKGLSRRPFSPLKRQQQLEKAHPEEVALSEPDTIEDQKLTVSETNSLAFRPSPKSSRNQAADKAVRRAKHILRASYFASSVTDSENLDIVNVNDDVSNLEDPSLSHDKEKVRSSLSELERSIRFIRKADPGFAWESKIDKSNWSSMEQSLFKQVHMLLSEDTLRRLVYQNDVNFGHIYVLNIIRRSSQCLRDLFAGFCFWDTDLIDWLHCILCNSLSNQLLVTYLQMLQNLKLDIPTLIDGIIERCKPKVTSLTSDFWVCLNRKLADPIATVAPLVTGKVQTNAQIVVIPDVGLSGSKAMKNANRRHRYYLNQLSTLGKVSHVNMQTMTESSGTPESYLSNVVGTVRAKISELKQMSSKKPIVLVGFGLGSLIGASVAADMGEAVTCCVCIGVPLRSINGTHTAVEDYLAQVTCPVLFVVGEMSKLCLLDDLEDLRANMVAKESCVIVVDGCNDNLTLTQRKCFEQKITQSMLDKYIFSEITAFMSGLLNGEPINPGSQLQPNTYPAPKEPKSLTSSTHYTHSIPTKPPPNSKLSFSATEKLQKVATRHKKALESLQDDESNAAANLLENLLESGDGSSLAVPFAKVSSNASSREVSPSRLGNLKRSGYEMGDDTSDDSDSGDSFASSSYTDIRRYGESMMANPMQRMIQLPYNSNRKQQLVQRGVAKGYKQAQSSSSFVHGNSNSRSNQKQYKKPQFSTLSYSEDIVSGTL